MFASDVTELYTRVPAVALRHLTLPELHHDIAGLDVIAYIT